MCMYVLIYDTKIAAGNLEIDTLRRQTDSLNLKKGQHTFVLEQVIIYVYVCT